MRTFIYFASFAMILSAVVLGIGFHPLHADDSYLSDMAEEDSAAEGEAQEAMDEADLEAAGDTDEVDTGVDDGMDAVDEASDEASF